MKDNKKESKIILFLRNNKKLILSMLIFNIFFFILMFFSVINVKAFTSAVFDMTESDSSYCDVNDSLWYDNYITDFDSDIDYIVNNSSFTSDNYFINTSGCVELYQGTRVNYFLTEFNGDLGISFGNFGDSDNYMKFTASSNYTGGSTRFRVWSFTHNITTDVWSSSSYDTNTSGLYEPYVRGLIIDKSGDFDLIYDNSYVDFVNDYSSVDIDFGNNNGDSFSLNDSINIDVFVASGLSFGVPPLDRINLGVNGDSVLFYFKDYSILSASNYIKTFNLNGLYEIFNFSFNNFISELDSPNFYLQYNTHYYKPTSEIGLRYGNRDLDVWGNYSVNDPFELIYQSFDGLGTTAPLFKAIYNVGENNMPSVKNYYYIDLDLSNVGYVIFDYNGYVISTDNVDNSISYIDSDSNNVIIDLSPYVVPDSNLYDNIGSSFNNFLAPIGSIFHLVDYGVVNSGEIIQPFIFILLFLGVMYFVVKALL